MRAFTEDAKKAVQDKTCHRGMVAAQREIWDYARPNNVSGASEYSFALTGHLRHQRLAEQGVTEYEGMLPPAHRAFLEQIKPIIGKLY
jgi:hypothetical protein